MEISNVDMIELKEKELRTVQGGDLEHLGYAAAAAVGTAGAVVAAASTPFTGAAGVAGAAQCAGAAAYGWGNLVDDE